MYLCLQADLSRWRECSQERPCCLVDIRLGHHRVVIGVLPIMKGGGVLDRDTRHAAEAIEIERGDIALRPNRCGMRGNGHLSLDRGVPGRDDRRGIGDDLDAIGSGEQGACYDRLAVWRGIVQRHFSLSSLSSGVAGAGGRSGLTLCRDTHDEEACGNRLWG